jgi:hypothetical protein
VLLGTAGSASSSTSNPSASPFSFKSCQPRPKRCARDRSPVSASKSVVRPGRRNGGTTLVFTLKQKNTVRFTVIRVYPTCVRVGSFSVSARAGVNRVRFRGRLGRRPLGEGTYRLVAQARGQESAAATLTIVVAHGKTTPAELRRARRANACSLAEAHEIETAIGAAPAGSDDDGGKANSVVERVADPVLGAAKAVVKKAKAVPAAIREAVADSPLSDPFVLAIVGLLTLAFALLGTLVLLHVVRIMGIHDKGLR